MTSSQKTISSRNSDTINGNISYFLTFFAVSYLAQGTNQNIGITSQPVKNYFMNVEGLGADQVSGVVAALMVPWLLKPLYGMFSDFLPLLGSSRKSYLVVSNLLAAIFFLLVLLSPNSTVIFWTLCFAFTGVAFANATMNGLSVQILNKYKNIRSLWGLQAISFFAANIICGLIAGWFCHNLGPGLALNMSSVVAGTAAIGAVLASVFLLREDKKKNSLKESFKTIKQRFFLTVRKSRFWFVCLLLCFWNFSPSLGVPLYFYESKKLGFDQQFIGFLSSIESFGMLIGSIVFYAIMSKWLTIDKQLYLALGFGTLSHLGFAFLASGEMAVILHFLNGVGTILAILALYAVATTVCLKKAEATTFAVLISLYNLSGQIATVTGGFLYEQVLNNNLCDLVYISTFTSFLAIFIVRNATDNSRSVMPN